MRRGNASPAAGARRGGARRGPRATPAGAKPNRAEKARLTRERLLRAATEIVGEDGYAGTSIAKITARAEVALGTFYNYFASRQDLLDQLLPTVGEELLEFVRSRVGEIADPVARERTRLVAFFDYLTRNPHFYRILNEAEVFAPAGFRRHMRNMADSYRRALAHDARKGDVRGFDEREREAIAFMLLAARNYLSMRYSYRAGRVRRVPRHVIDAYTKLLTGGLFGQQADGGAG